MMKSPKYVYLFEEADGSNKKLFSEGRERVWLK